MKTFAAFVSVVGVGLIIGVGCGKKDEAPPPVAPNPAGSGYPQQYPQGYPQQQPQGYPQQQPQGYPQQQPQGYPQPTAGGGYPQPQPQGQPGPGPGPTPAGGALAVPGPAALPCSNDSMCLTHKCNTQYGKCAFPCESDHDCIQGAFCFKGPVAACLAKPPGQQ